MAKVEHAFFGMTLAGCCSVMGLVGWIVWSMYADFNFFQAPAVWPVSNKVVKPGGDVFSDLSFCKTADVATTEIGRMTTGKTADGDEYLFIHPNVSGSFPPGCYKKRVSVATVPPNAPPGTYRVAVTIRYQYSVFRTVIQRFVTEQFVVAP